MQPAEEMSQIEINGISIPENGSTLQKVSNEHRTKENNSSLQMNNFGIVATEVLPDQAQASYEHPNSNAQFKQVGVTQPIYSGHLSQEEAEGFVQGRRGQNNTHKRLIDRKKQQPSFPVKVTNLNNMVQIRKKKPKMKYNDRLIYRSN